MKKVLAVSIMVLSCSVLSAYAADEISPSHRQAIMALIELSGSGVVAMQAYIDTAMGSFFKHKQEDLKKLSEENRNKVKGIMQRFFSEIMSSMVSEVFVPSIARHLTEDDVRQLIQFYNMPIGRKYASLNLQFTKELLPLMETWTQTKLKDEQFQKRMKQYGEEFKAIETLLGPNP